MDITQVRLTEQEIAALQAIAERTGKSREALIHEAVEQLIAQFPREARLARLQQARGIWRDRDDLAPLDELRNAWRQVGL